MVDPRPHKQSALNRYGETDSGVVVLPFRVNTWGRRNFNNYPFLEYFSICNKIFDFNYDPVRLKAFKQEVSSQNLYLPQSNLLKTKNLN